MHPDLDRSVAVDLFDAATGTLKAHVGRFEYVVGHRTFT